MHGGRSSKQGAGLGGAKGRLLLGLSALVLLGYWSSSSLRSGHRAQHAAGSRSDRQLVQTAQAGGTGQAVLDDPPAAETGDTLPLRTAPATPTAPPPVKSKTARCSSFNASSSAPERGPCYVYYNTDLWGDALTDGTNHKKDTAEQCCKACQEFKPKGNIPGCNTWVWCGDQRACGSQHRECWLKHLPYPENSRAGVRELGPGVTWTSGSVGVDLRADLALEWKTVPNVFQAAKAQEAASTFLSGQVAASRWSNPSCGTAIGQDGVEVRARAPAAGGAKQTAAVRRYHTVTSAQSFVTHWQMRIHYYHFKKQRAVCRRKLGTACEMGGFTRLLHEGAHDDLEAEIPTVVVDPMPDSVVKHDDYIVLNRPYAFVMWLKVAKIPERYVLMAEPDHVFIRPLPNLMRTDDEPVGYPFGYMAPQEDQNKKHIYRLWGFGESAADLDHVYPIGNSPVIMNMDQMKIVLPTWLNMSITIYKDAEANKEWGWIMEMYAFAISMPMAGVKSMRLVPEFMSQPPWEDKMFERPGRPYYIIHYTYGLDFNNSGKTLYDKVGEWHWDKRDFNDNPPARGIKPPPEKATNELAFALISSFNEAMDAIPCWPEYVKTAKIPKTCDEAPKHYLAKEKEEEQWWQDFQVKEARGKKEHSSLPPAKKEHPPLTEQEKAVLKQSKEEGLGVLMKLAGAPTPGKGAAA